MQGGMRISLANGELTHNLIPFQVSAAGDDEASELWWLAVNQWHVTSVHRGSD